MSAPAVLESELIRLGAVADRLLAGRPLFSHGSRPHPSRAGHGLELLELRPYVQGDDPRAIDWVASARTRQRLVRRYRDETFSNILICLDASSSMAADDGAKWTLATQLASAFAYLGLHAGNRVGALCFGAEASWLQRPVRGRAHYARLSARLGGVRVASHAERSELQACGSHVRRGDTVIVISDFLAPDCMQPGLERLLRRADRVHALQLGEAAPVAATAQRVVLRDVESGEQRELSLTDEVFRRYALRLAEHDAELARFCAQRGVPLTRCAGGDGWRAAVLSHLTRLHPFRA